MIPRMMRMPILRRRTAINKECSSWIYCIECVDSILNRFAMLLTKYKNIKIEIWKCQQEPAGWLTFQFKLVNLLSVFFLHFLLPIKRIVWFTMYTLRHRFVEPQLSRCKACWIQSVNFAPHNQTSQLTQANVSRFITR